MEDTDIQRNSPSRTPFVVCVIVLVVIGVLLFLFRAPLSLSLWYDFQLAPEMAAYFNSEDTGLMIDLGNYYFNIKDEGKYDLDRAEKYYTQAIMLDREVNDAWYQLARISFLKGQFTAALFKANKQLEFNGESIPAVYYIRGLIYGFSKNYKKAEADLAYYLQNWNQDSWYTHTDLAWTQFMQGEYARSADTAYLGLQFHPDNPWLLTMHGVSLINTGQLHDAKASLEKADVEAAKLTEEDWARAYPGNDPAIRTESLAFMKKRISDNLSFIPAYVD